MECAHSRRGRRTPPLALPSQQPTSTTPPRTPLPSFSSSAHRHDTRPPHATSPAPLPPPLLPPLPPPFNACTRAHLSREVLNVDRGEDGQAVRPDELERELAHLHVDDHVQPRAALDRPARTERRGVCEEC